MNSPKGLLLLGVLLGSLHGCSKLDQGTCIQAVSDLGNGATVQLCDVNSSKYSCVERAEPGEFHDVDTEAGMQLCESRGFKLDLSMGQELDQLIAEGASITYSKSTAAR